MVASELKNTELDIETKDAGDVEQRFDEYHAANLAALDGVKKELETERKRSDELELKLNRINLGTTRSSIDKTDNRQADLEKKAFETFVRKGREALSPDEVKALITSNDTQGGYLAPEQFERELLRNVVDFSPMRQVARVATASAGAVLLPKRTSGMTAQWVGETGARPETSVTFGQNRYDVRELAAYVDVSNAMLEDSAFDINAELAFEFAEEFGHAEAKAFVVGSGPLQPAGIMTELITDVVSGSATTIADSDGQANGLITALYALSPAYRGRATWMMNSSTLASVRKLKDGDKNYIWKPGVADGQPDTILGRPVIEAPDMPNEGAGATPILVGDFSQYRIFDRISLSILRDPFTQAANGMVRFHGRRRVAGGVGKTEAFRKVKCST